MRPRDIHPLCSTVIAAAALLTPVRTYSQGVRLAPLSAPHVNYFAGSEVLERYLKVQGVDRQREQVYPRRIEFEIIGPPPGRTRVRFLEDIGNRYALEITTSGRTYHEYSSGGDDVWQVMDEVGIGKSFEKHPLVGVIRRERRDERYIVQKHSFWERLPDEDFEGRKLHVVGMKYFSDKGGELWFFSAETGALVRSGGPLNAPDAEQDSARWSDFRDVDGVLEPFELAAGSGERLVVKKILSLENRVPVKNADFGPKPAEFSHWLETERMIEAYINACGGKLALGQVVSRITELKGEISGGATFALKIWQKAPNFVLIESDMPGVGKEWQGFDGSNAWEASELKGERTLSREQMAMFLRTYSLQNTEENFGKLYPLRKWLGPRNLDGRKIAVMELASMGGKAGTYYFEESTGRLVRIETVFVDGPSFWPFMIDLSDFTDFQGIVMPRTAVATNPAMRIITKVSSVKNNVEIADEVFRRRTGE